MTIIDDKPGQLRIVVKDHDGNDVEVPQDPNRIHGLVLEDRVRTTAMFTPRTIAENPTAPVDIPPRYDILQGLPTHVKTAKGPTVHMASAYRFFQLAGYQRLVIATSDPYEISRPGSTPILVNCYPKMIEAILSPTTLEVCRGSVTLEEMTAIQDAASAYNWRTDDFEETKWRITSMIHAVRHKMGIARFSLKMTKPRGPNGSGWQCRPQVTISIRKLLKQLVDEPDYEGRFRQSNVIVHDASFYGLALPWRTTGEKRIFRAQYDHENPPAYRKTPSKRRRLHDDAPETTVPLLPEEHALYVENWITETALPFDGGLLMIRRHGDDMRTIRTESGAPEVHRRVFALCAAQDGRWIEPTGSWLVTFEGARAVAEELTGREFGRPAPKPRIMVLPSAEGPSILRVANTKSGNDRDFETPDGIVRAIRLEKNNWALRSQENPEVAARIAATCHAYKVGKRRAKQNNWLIAQDPPELIERVARAIRDHGPRGTYRLDDIVQT